MRMRSSISRHPELVSGSIFPHTRSKRGEAQPHRKVAPLGVRAVDQIDLPRSLPVFQLLLAGNRALHVAEHLEVNEPVDRIAGREALGHTFAVLPQSLHQVRRHADVSRAVVPAGEDVDAGVALNWHNSKHAARWMLKQVQHDEVFGGISCR